MKLRMLSFLMACAFVSHAQVRCLSDSQTEMAAIDEWEYGDALKLADAMLKEVNLFSMRDGFKEITVPVVVHVLYREIENNISMEQIQSQIEVLNRDFNLENDDVAKVPEPFRSLAGSSKIRFRLADKDPWGNFTSGVTRTQTTVENIGTEGDYYRTEKGGHDPWPQPHYMNVWVCELEGNALGFAVLPAAQMSVRDGIVMSPRAFGTTGTAKPPYNGGRTFVHEVGHYFGLRHLWGSDDESCESTDYCDDTPVQLKENFGCKEFPSFSCPNEPNGDMFMNYMDYGNDTCMLLFTQKQVQLMQLVLKTNRVALFHSPGFTGQNERVRQDRFYLYPNPSDGLVYLEFLDDVPKVAEIFDLQGRLIACFSISDRIERLDIRKFSPGIYYVVAGKYSSQLMVK